MIRSRYRLPFAAFAAILAITALTAASASAALPEFSKGTGKLNGTGTSASFEATKIGSWSFRTAALASEITSTKTIGAATLTFTEGAPALGPCYTGYGKGWETVLPGLTGRLGYISKSAHTVGLMFEPVKQPIAKCTIDGNTLREYLGDFIGKLTPVNTKTRKYVLHFSQSGGKQEPQWFEGETENFPETFPFALGNNWSCHKLLETEKNHCSFTNDSGMGLNSELAIEFPEEFEIKA